MDFRFFTWYFFTVILVPSRAGGGNNSKISKDILQYCNSDHVNHRMRPCIWMARNKAWNTNGAPDQHLAAIWNRDNHVMTRTVTFVQEPFWLTSCMAYIPMDTHNTKANSSLHSFANTPFFLKPRFLSQAAFFCFSFFLEHRG